MNVIILAAGFGTRLYPLTKEHPKALLKVNQKPLIEYILDKIEEIKETERIYILSNNKFYEKFSNWLDNFKKRNKIADKIKLLNNNVMNEEDKKGAITDLQDCLNTIEKNDALILAADNIFNFSLKELLDFSKLKNSSAIALKIINTPDLIKKYSCVLLDENKKIIYFEEKPRVPKSNICSTACYILKEHDLDKIKNNCFKNSDNMGMLIEFLCKNSIIHGLVYEDFWADIGSIEELNKVNEVFISPQMPPPRFELGSQP